LKADVISPKGLRIAQIVLGVIAIALSISVMAQPRAGVTLLVFLLSVTLLVLGIERVIAGIGLTALPKSSRIGNIILGGLTVILGIIVISYPLFAAGFLILLLAIGLLFMGIARILYGVMTRRKASQWSRAFAIGVGVLSIAVSIMVFASPLLGAFLLTLVLAINLLILGIESIAHGISGRKHVSAQDYGR
jgi:uncharacterized membrane protein HdeD (DUF308 family)